VSILIFSSSRFLFSGTSYSQIIGFDGGVKDDYLYKEVIFLTGKPIVVEGEVKVQEREKGDIITTTYTFELRNDEEEVVVKRRVGYETNLYKKEDFISGYKEIYLQLGGQSVWQA